MIWPTEDGWPYPDSAVEVSDPSSVLDGDGLAQYELPETVFHGLTPTERAIVEARFGLNGSPMRTLGELHVQMGIPRSHIRQVLAAALVKLRTQLVS